MSTWQAAGCRGMRWMLKGHIKDKCCPRDRAKKKKNKAMTKTFQRRPLIFHPRRSWANLASPLSVDFLRRHTVSAVEPPSGELKLAGHQGESARHYLRLMGLRFICVSSARLEVKPAGVSKSSFATSLAAVLFWRDDSGAHRRPLEAVCPDSRRSGSLRPTLEHHTYFQWQCFSAKLLVRRR